MVPASLPRRSGQVLYADECVVALSASRVAGDQIGRHRACRLFVDDVVETGATIDEVVAAATTQPVVARAAEQRVGLLATTDTLESNQRAHAVGAAGAATGQVDNDRSVGGEVVGDIEARTAVDDVVAQATAEELAIEQRAAGELVVAGGAEHGSDAAQHVIAVGAAGGAGREVYDHRARDGATVGKVGLSWSLRAAVVSAQRVAAVGPSGRTGD